MIIFRIILLLVLVLCFTSGCKRQDEGIRADKPGNDKESLIRVNKYLIDKDKEIIENYIERRGWKMELTKSGLWYMIYDKGRGEKIDEGCQVTINYTVHLLDGTLCYHSDDTGPKHFIVGSGGIEIGLDEGIRLLRMGDKARFILPPHLAYGLIGDENMIPARSVIVYDLEVISIQN